jgi:hypothetical protein
VNLRVLHIARAHNAVISLSGLLSLGRELPNFIDINLDPASRQAIGGKTSSKRGSCSCAAPPRFRCW